MSNEFEILVDTTAAERDLSRETVVKALEEGLSEAARQFYGGDGKNREEGVDVRVRFTSARLTERETHRVWTVVATADEMEDEERQMVLEEATAKDPEVGVGELVRDVLENTPDSRISARRTKVMWLKKIREAVAEQVAHKYRQQIGSLLSGEVKRVTEESVFVELAGNVEARLPRSNLLSGDKYKVGEQVRGVLEEIDDKSMGPQLVLTRHGVDILRHLFRIEVPEINDGTVVICGVAREPGVRSKMAVRSGDGRVDPVGACIGARGVRVQAVTDEFASQERIDIVAWDDNVTQFVINSMSLPENVRIFIDEDNHCMDIIVDEDDLGHAIGRFGQNVRLTSELCGWELNVMTEKEQVEKTERNRQGPRELFMKGLNIEENMADILVNDGFYALEDIRDTPVEELAAVEGIDEELAQELIKRVKRTLIFIARGHESVSDLVQSSPELLDLKGMDTAMAYELAKHGIRSLETLADYSVDDLADLELQGFKDAVAGEWIMNARKHKFLVAESES